MGKNNISKFNQIDNIILLEYIINNFLDDTGENDAFDKDVFSLNDNQVNIINWKIKSDNDTGLLYVDNISNYTNNGYNHICVPIDKECSDYFEPSTKEDLINFYKEKTNEDLLIEEYYSNNHIAYDTIKLHILSGYSFDDIYGVMLKVYSLNNNKEIIHLSNWIYKNTDLNYHFEKPIIINNKFFDKFIEVKIPSIQYLKSQNIGEDRLADFINKLNINNEDNSYLPNICIEYTIIKKENIENVFLNNLETNRIIGKKISLDNVITYQIAYNSLSDNFNLYMAESTTGDYIDFYTTWCDNPLSSSIVSLFNTRYQLYETERNIYKENIYDIEEDKNQWFVIHDIVTVFNGVDSNGNRIKVIPDERYSITQEFNYENNERKTFKYKPILLNDIECSNITDITFNYTAKLVNRIDGTQIIRYGSLTTTKKEKYMSGYYKLNTKNLVNYSIYNKNVNNEQSISNLNYSPKQNYIKVFYNVKDIFIDEKNSYGIINDELLLKRNTSTYKFIFKRKNENKNEEFVNLNDMCSYLLVFYDENGKDIEIQPTYSSNMNLSIGEIEFTITKNTINKLLKTQYNHFDILVLNSNGSRSTMYEGIYKFQ